MSVLLSDKKAVSEIRKGYDLISTGLLYLDQNRASLVAIDAERRRRGLQPLHGPEVLRAIDLAEKAIHPLQAVLGVLKTKET